MKKIAAFILGLILVHTDSFAQPFVFKSTGATKTFTLEIFYGSEGKGAFVQYSGQSGIIPLKIKSRLTSNTNKSVKTQYVWDELLDGKINGNYGLTEEAGQISAAWYLRKKDGKKFQLEHQAGAGAEMDKYLLHGALISFYHISNTRLEIAYQGGTKEYGQLTNFDHPDPLRKGTIADYNFDGYDDVAFSIPDAGMGVYRIFSIYVYNPHTKRFKKLPEPNDSRSNCSGLCDVTLDVKNKLLMSTCRGAATWWKDSYRFSTGNKLIWVSSKKSN